MVRDCAHEAWENVTVNIDGQIIKVTNDLHVQELDTNLLLISALNRNGLSVHFSIDEVKIRRGNTTVASRMSRDKIYYLHTSQTHLLSSDAGATDSEYHKIFHTR